MLSGLGKIQVQVDTALLPGCENPSLGAGFRFLVSL
jgi:hypothetical protein